MKPLIIRADASPEIGTGHIMRCLALAEAWQDAGGVAIFVSAYDVPALEDRLEKEGIEIVHISPGSGSHGDADETARIAHTRGADWIVVDGYQFGSDYQKRIKGSGFSLLFIDDYGHADHYFADIVLNQNVYAGMSLYKKYEPYTRFLLGTEYALLRREFLTYSGWHRDIPDIARHILVTLGGSDPDNATLSIIDAVKAVDVNGLEVIIVIGGANPYFDLIHASVKDLPNVTLIKNAGNMPELMAWADIAISAGGSTCWELAFMGVPSILYAIAENQKLIARELVNIHAALGLPDRNLISIEDAAGFISLLLKKKKLRSDLSQSQKRLVDGTGANNIVLLLRGET